jgi:hypothetical protein
MVVALNVHRAIIVARHRELSERANVTKSEWTELEALRQAEVAYTILAASDLHGGFFDLFKSLLGKEVELSAEEKNSAAQAATDFCVARESLDDLVCEARRLLTNLCLPTTVDDFTDLDRNRYRIQIDLRYAKPNPEGYADSLQERYTHITSGLRLE